MVTIRKEVCEVKSEIYVKLGEAAGAKKGIEEARFKYVRYE
ncbi:MAG: hypothetical protein ACJATN_001911 [Neolewinella sp.]